jgi:uncharacterized protein YacL (UPF0231 family)
MTKRLEELLNLPDNKKMVEKAEKLQEANEKSTTPPLLRDMAEFDKISAALPQVRGLGDLSDTEFDALAQRATDAYDDLMDLGMNVEARYSSRIFEVAGGMLKNAIDAKSAKIDKKLKMIELQLKKQALDQKTGPQEDSVTVHGEGVIVSDRNSLIEKLKNMNK